MGISWLADLLQLMLSADTFWKGIALICLAYVGTQFYRTLKALRQELAAANLALVEDGKPIALAPALSAFAAAQKQCFLNQAKCMELQCEFRDEPWRFCEKFADCPAIQGKVAMDAHIEKVLNAYLEKELTYFQDILDRLAENNALTLETRSIITSFTKDLGTEVIRAITTGNVPAHKSR